MAEGIKNAVEGIIKENKHKEMIDTTKMPLGDWLDLLTPENKEKYNFIDYCFPTEAMKIEYITSIGARSDSEVKDLMRNFLIPSGSLYADELAFQGLMAIGKQDRNRLLELLNVEFYRRLFRAYLFNEDTVWEGNTWVLDLLPDYPKKALDVLHAYFLAHIQHLPDGRWGGLQDAMALIRAKFIQAPTSTLLKEIDPYQLEYLIDSLYSKMGYKTSLTKRTHDGGIDIIAIKEKTGKRETIFIQCKQKKKKVDINIARELLAVVSEGKQRANKGVLVAPGGFTTTVKALQQTNPRIELLDNQELQILLNTYLGPYWSANIDRLIGDRLRVQKAGK